MTWRGRNIYLVGLPGAGKTAIGHHLATLLSECGYGFMDLDDEIEVLAKRPINQIFRESGESHFRKLETSALLIAEESVAMGNPIVVATGGGTILSRNNRSIMRGSGIPVWIDASVRDAARNVSRDRLDGKSRPLLDHYEGEELNAALQKILDERCSYYEQATLHFVPHPLSSETHSANKLACELRKALDEMPIQAAQKPNYRTRIAKSLLGDYPILVGCGITDQELSHWIRDRGVNNVVIVTDSTVEELHTNRICKNLEQSGIDACRIQTITIPAGEANKNKASLFDILEAINASGLRRTGSAIIAIGGGVITDIAGLAANLFKRGVPLISVPTTLLAQVDASIGGKNGIDLFGVKNLIGTFKSAAIVIVDPLFLETLPLRELHAGLAEVIKCALIGDRDLWDKLESRLASLLKGADSSYSSLIWDSIGQKLHYVEQDEFEAKGGIRELLNFGHTFGHALESATHFEQFLHGEAVTLGMRAAAWLSKELGYLSEEEFSRIEEILSALPLPLSKVVSADAVFCSFGQDKKRLGSRHRVILLREIGRAITTDIDNVTAQSAINYMIRLL